MPPHVAVLFERYIQAERDLAAIRREERRLRKDRKTALDTLLLYLKERAHLLTEDEPRIASLKRELETIVKRK